MQKGVREDDIGAGIRGSNMPSCKILRQAGALGSQIKLKPACLESKGGEKWWKVQLKGGKTMLGRVITPFSHPQRISTQPQQPHISTVDPFY